MTEEETLLIELAQMYRTIEEKVRRQQHGELFICVDECIDAINQAKESK